MISMRVHLGNDLGALSSSEDSACILGCNRLSHNCMHMDAQLLRGVKDLVALTLEECLFDSLNDTPSYDLKRLC